MWNHQPLCPAHLSPVATSQIHAFGFPLALPIISSSIKIKVVRHYCRPLCHPDLSPAALFSFALIIIYLKHHSSATTNNKKKLLENLNWTDKPMPQYQIQQPLCIYLFFIMMQKFLPLAVHLVSELILPTFLSHEISYHTTFFSIQQCHLLIWK